MGGLIARKTGDSGVLATADIFLFEEFRLDRQGDGLSRRDKRGVFVPISIGLRALDILLVLIERSGRLVTREEIMADVWGRTVVGSANLAVQISALCRVLDQGRSEGSAIQTVAARGYRFLPAVMIGKPALRPERSGGSRSVPPLSIVVLPFANLGNDPEQRYFADGITDDLTTDLSRIAGMLVISRNTAFTYRNQRVETKQIGRDLAVRYVLEGSVRRSGNQVRVNAQLIEAESDTHLWTERFDGEMSDLFALQDEVVSRIAIALNLELPRAEAARPTHNPDALDLILRGRAVMNKQQTKDNYAEAISLFERALVLDHRSIQGLTYLAHNLSAHVLDDMTGSPGADIKRAEELIAQALAQSPNSPLAH
jgi:TolB-like protein